MKSAVLTLLALALTLPARSFANSVDLTNLGGILTGSAAGLVLSGSELTSIRINGRLITGDLGTVSIDTGPLFSGSLKTGGVFGFPTGDNGGILFTDSSLKVKTLFAADFVGEETWKMITLANGTHSYTLTGVLEGVWFEGQRINGATVQLTINTGTGFFNGRTTLASGDTNINGSNLTVPEPGSLTLLGSGLLTIAGAVRRKLRGV